MQCSILQASFKAVVSSTPSDFNISDNTIWRSKIFSAMAIPLSVKVGGKNAQKIMQAFNIQENDILMLESVENVPVYKLGQGEHFILTNQAGLRIFLKKDQAEAIIVSYAEK